MIPAQQIARRRTAPFPPRWGMADVEVSKPDLAAVIVLLLVMTFHATGFYDLVGKDALRVVLAVEYSIFAGYMVVAAVRRHFIALAASLSFAGFMILQAATFERVSGFPMNVNASLAQGTLLATLVFYETRTPLVLIARIMLGLSLLYLALYDVAWPIILDIAGQGSSLWLSANDARGVRLFCATSFAFYVITLGAFRVGKYPASSLFLIAIGGYALFIAQARFGLAISLLGFLAAYSHWLVPFLRRNLNTILASAFILISLVFVYGFVDESWNPYSLIMQDQSGLARYLQYQAGQRMFGGHYLLGIGIPGGFDDLQAFGHPARPMFLSDLGVYGVALEFGVIFFLIYLVACVRVIVVPRIGNIPDRDTTMAILHTAQVCVLASFFTALIPNVASVIFVGLTLAYNATRLTRPANGGRRAASGGRPLFPISSDGR